MGKNKKKMLKKILVRTSIVLGSLLLLLSAAIGFVLNFIFTPEKLTPMVRDMAQEYVTTELEIGGVELTFFSTFPNFSVKIDTLAVNLPCDTLAPLLYTEHFVASINPLALLDNEIVVNRITLEGANINLYVDSLIKPFSIFKLPSDTAEEDTTAAESEAYSISLDEIRILSSNVIVEDRRKDFYSKFENISLELSANFNSSLVDLDMVLDLPDIVVREGRKKLATNESLLVDAEMQFNRDSLILNITQADLRVNSIDLKSSGVLSADSTHTCLYVDINSTLSTPSISEFLKFIPPTIIDNKESLTTEGVVDLDINFKGEYTETSKPIITANVNIDNAKAKYGSRKVYIEDIDCDAMFYLDLNKPKNSYTTIKNFKISSTGIIDLVVSGKITNMMVDPYFDINLISDINFTRLSEVFPIQEGLKFQGSSSSNLSTQVSLSNITSSNFGELYLTGESVFTDVKVAINGSKFTGDTTVTGFFFVDMKEANMLFGENVRSDNDSRTLLSTISLSDLGFKNRQGEFILINNLSVSAGANFDNKTKQVNGLGVVFDAQDVDMGIQDQLDVDMKQTSVKMTISPKNEVRSTKIAGSLSSDSLTMFEYENNSAIALAKSSVEFELTEKEGDSEWGRKGTVGFSGLEIFSDLFPLDISLTRSNVEVNDNVIKLNNTRVQIGESSLVATGNVTNLIRSMFFTEDSKEQIEGRLTIRSKTLNLTELMEAINESVLLSDTTATEDTSSEVLLAENGISPQREGRNEGSGNMEGAQRNSNGGQKNSSQERRNVDRSTDSVFNAQDFVGNRALRDSALMSRRSPNARNRRRMTTQQSSVFLVPKNINFDLVLNLSTVLYEGGSVDSVKGKATIKEGVLNLEKLSFQAIGAQANTSMEYRNVNNRMSSVHLDLDLQAVDINRLGELMPQVDTLMPMMKSFEGSVDFDLRAVGTISGRNGFDLSRMRAAVDMKGRNLVLMDSETFTNLSKLLMFKNKDRNLIDSMAMYIIADSSRFDVLPFQVDIDRYQAIVGGTQVVDTSYNIIFDYNVSIMKSPLPFKAGVDIKGDLDDFDYDITRAKLKTTDFDEQRQIFSNFRESLVKVSIDAPAGEDRQQGGDKATGNRQREEREDSEQDREDGGAKRD